MKNKVLLHICCGVCATGVIQALEREGFEVTGFFYNPNIHPQEEYQKRLDVAREVCRDFGVLLLEGSYDLNKWFTLTDGLESQHEGGKRCSLCFDVRLREAFLRAKQAGLDYVATTLTISPHKNAELINSLGKHLEKEVFSVKFMERDFKKNGGFKKTMEYAKQYNLYRQHYCGCVYSLRDALRKGK